MKKSKKSKLKRDQEGKGSSRPRRRSTSDRTVAVAIDRALNLLNNTDERDENYVLREFHSILPSETSSYVIGLKAGAELLRVAIKRKRRSVVLYMLCRMNNIVNVADERDGSTALHCAARGDNIKIAIALMEHGAKLEARDRRGRRPIHYATSRRMIRFLKFEAKCVTSSSSSSSSSSSMKKKQLKDIDLSSIHPMEYLALVDWSVQERVKKRRKRKNRTTRSYEKPLKEFVVTDHSPRVRVRTLRKFCDESLEKMCFPDNLAYFLHEVTRTTAKKKKRSDSSIREILLQLHRQCMDINLEEYISRTRFFCGRWHATSDDRTYVIGNHVCVVTAADDFHHSSSEGEMHDVVPSSSSEDEGEIPVGIVSSSEEDEGETHVGIVPSSASDDDDYVDRENFKSDEFNAPEPPPRNEIQWVYGRSSPDSKIWQKWAHIMMLYEESETTTVKLQFLHDDGEEEEVRGQLIVNRDNGQISIQWDDGDVWNRVESSPSLGMNRVSKLWRVWSCLRQCLFDDDVENENIYRFTFGNNTRSCPLIWCIVPIERSIVGPSLCDEFERRQNGTVRRSAIVAVSRFPYVFFPQTFFSSLKLSLSRTHTNTNTEMPRQKI